MPVLTNWISCSCSARVMAVGRPGALVQILQMPGIGDHGRWSAVPHLGKETVGGELAGDGVHQTAVALYLHLQCQVGALGSGCLEAARWEKRLPSVRSSSTMVTV